jgi:predicted  nucleic acid-binding Zn-ribbon protein
MLLRISLIVAILAGLGAAGLGYYEVSSQIPQLTNQRDTEHTAKQNALGELAKTKSTLKKTQSDLAQTQQDLADTKSDLDKAVAKVDAESRQVTDLNQKLTDMTSQRDDANNQLAAYKATGLNPQQILALDKELTQAKNGIVALNDENSLLSHKLKAVQAKLDSIIGPDQYVKLPANLKGSVVVVDPKWGFVVVNVGEAQGAVSNGELLVSRQGKLVAKVVLRNVEKNRSIANLVPGWKLGDPIEGDEVTPAHPDI